MTGRTGRSPPAPPHPGRSRGAAGSAAGNAAPPSSPRSVRRLRLAIFSDAIPGRNGVATYYDDLIHHLAPLMDGVVLVSPPAGQPEGTGRFSLSMPGDPTQRIYLPEARRVWREMGDLSPDVVISATPGPFGALGMAVAFRLRAGFCVAFHTQLDALAGLYWEQQPGGRALRAGIRLWDRVMFRCAGEVVVHNEELVGAVRERGAASARVMGTAAGRAFIAGSPPPVGATVRNVAFIGRLAPEKEIGQVWEAARRFPDIRFRFAGDGPLRATVEGWAREAPNVESLGWLRRAEVLELLDASDVLVLPSRHETFGSIALEAMARGRIPVVSPNCGISRWPELAPGLVVMGEGERAAGALGRVMGMRAEVREELSRAGRAAARELTERTVREWADVIGRTARSRRPP